MKSEIVAQGMTAADLDKLDLIADVQFNEPMGSAALNRKFYGIMPAGIYRGFMPVVRGGLKVSVGDSPVNVAAIDVDGFMISVQGRRPVELTVPTGRKVYCVIEANYAIGLRTTQVDVTASMKAADIRMINADELRGNHVIVFSANLPADTTEIRADQLEIGERQEADIGSDAIDRHTKNYLNPHQVNKGQIGLSDVENYGVATVEEAQAGTATHKYMTPALTKTAIESISSPVPLPDVWIPFNDSLRMITGFGDYDRVYIGEQYLELNSRSASFERATTATYIDKSGVLRTAAINEPRFEKQGLLIEGQSTNLINGSETYKPTVHGGVTAVSTSEVMGFNFVKQVNDGSNGGTSPTMSGKFDIKKGDVLTYSAVFRLPADGEAAGRFRCRIGHDGGFAFDLSFYNELSNDREVNAATNVITKTQPFADKSLVKVVRTFTAAADYTGAFVQLQSLQVEGVTNVGCHQLEVLPFASSYIPTNGTAVTRSADKCWIQWALNINPDAVTVAVNYSVAGLNPAFPQRVIEYGSPTIPRYLFQINSLQEMESYVGSSPCKVRNIELTNGVVIGSTSPTKHTLRVGDKPLTVATPAGAVGATSIVSIGGGNAGGSNGSLFGHVRNLRIWHHALSDAQIKGLA